MTGNVLNVRPDVEYPQTGIEDKKRLAGLLTGVLADSYILMVKTQGYHWNVVGPLFTSVHELTEKQYRSLFEAVDEIAERIRALGMVAPSSITEMIPFTEIQEDTANPSTEEMLLSLIADHEVVCRKLRKTEELAQDLGDAVTSDMMTQRMAFHENAIWMLRALVST
ncbi:MAG: DNA starvation/stationary phase protection protein [Kiloniellales bacterium]|nr:DNA starvation/stationary phase protection protein [Kiloniellales bacterium]